MLRMSTKGIAMNEDFIMSLLTDKNSKRSMQKQVGPSEIGGCSRKVWHRIHGTPKTNFDTLSMASTMGTAIHEWIEKKIKRDDPFEERYMREIEVSHDGLMGHADVYDVVDREVVDWKTTTKKNLANFPSQQQIWQVQVYGYLLTSNGYPVDTVKLVGIPRDGNETHVKVYAEPYDEAVALEAIAWLRNVEAMESRPDPEKHVRFCRDYCGFYDATEEVGCGGQR